MLVDTGPGGAEAGFQQALESVIDPDQVAWLWLTHTDPDHVGSLRWLLDARYPIDGASDHGVSEAVYLRDPDGNHIAVVEVPAE